MKTAHELAREYRIANRNTLQARCDLLRQKADELFRAYEAGPSDEAKGLMDDNARELVLVQDLIARRQFNRPFYVFDGYKVDCS
jgi:hypothetical protein